MKWESYNIHRINIEQAEITIDKTMKGSRPQHFLLKKTCCSASDIDAPFRRGAIHTNGVI